MRKITLTALLLASTVCFSQPVKMLESAESGYEWAQLRIGMMFEYGDEGAVQNDVEAVKWYRRAAEQGEEMGQYNLAMMLVKGRGVPQSVETAYFWLLLAGAKLEDARKTRNLVQKLLSPGQVTKIQAQAAAWKPKQP